LLETPKERHHCNMHVETETIYYVRCVRCDWIYLSHDSVLWSAFVTTVLTVWVSYKAGNFLASSAIISFSTRDLLQADAAPSLLRR